MTYPSNSILVLLDVTTDGVLASSAAGLLGAAPAIGTPVALVVSTAGEVADAAAALGAASVLIAAPGDGLAVGAVDALAAAAALVQFHAILVSNSIEGREVAGRLAVRTRSGIAVDAVGVARDAEGVTSQHSVYGGGYTVDVAVTFGAPVITIRQGIHRCTRRPSPRRPSSSSTPRLLGAMPLSSGRSTPPP